LVEHWKASMRSELSCAAIYSFSFVNGIVLMRGSLR